MTAIDFSLPVLSIRQPWAWLILNGGKDVENRTWRTNYRGRFLIHAAKGCTIQEWNAGRDMIDFVSGGRLFLPSLHLLERGGIVGEVELVDCLPWSNSAWHEAGFTGFILRNPKPLPFHPCSGRLGFFSLSIPAGAMPGNQAL